MTKLSDIQSILLSTATQRENGSLLPLPVTLKASGGTTKAIAALLKQGLAEERDTSDAGASRRVEGDTHYGLFITAAGGAAIGIEPAQGVGDSSAAPTAGSQPAEASPAPAPTEAKRTFKAANVIALLTRPDGATLPELIEATGWLPHTTRAALTGIRKKGHEITRTKRDGVTCYRIVEAA